MSATFIATNAAQNAAQAASRAAEKARCERELKGYDAGTASVEQMRDYARCVFTVHGSGEPLDPTVVLALKATILVSVIVAGVGFVRGWTKGDGFADGMMFGITGALLVWLAALVLGGLYFVFG